MIFQNVPEIFYKRGIKQQDFFVYDFKMTDDVFKSKVDLSMHMFSFLQKGKKRVYVADSSVTVDATQSLLIKKGNCLWSEMLENDDIYYCKLLFFSDEALRKILKKRSSFSQGQQQQHAPLYFTLENDDFIISYLTSLEKAEKADKDFANTLLFLKVEELIVYLINKYGAAFESYLYSMISNDSSSFKRIVEQHLYSNLKVEEIAFLCHMSLSTFKRNFLKEYGHSPGKWLSDKRLNRAKELLKEGRVKSSDIYTDFGYTNLSNFSAAFKNKFGVNPSDIH